MNTKDTKFVQEIYRWYRKEGRAHLPWRKTTDPYRIWISEIMLQQTQVDRVIPKYEAFLTRFPTVYDLAQATNTQVLALWSGLGYNRRALLAKRAAETVVAIHNGVFPRTHESLQMLPGIGPYTATAILAFAYNHPEVCIETNIRAVYIHFYFPKEKKVDDARLMPIIARTLDRAHPREWYWALMDYGSYLKKNTPNPSRRSAQHVVQKTFKGSVREVRGDILRTLLEKKKTTARQLQKKFEDERFEKALSGLIKDGLVQKKGSIYSLQ